MAGAAQTVPAAVALLAMDLDHHGRADLAAASYVGDSALHVAIGDGEPRAPGHEEGIVTTFGAPAFVALHLVGRAGRGKRAIRTPPPVREAVPA